jgi:tetratricopeptide (TPR) repeat protein
VIFHVRYYNKGFDSPANLLDRGDTIRRMRKLNLTKIVLLFAALALVAWLVYWLPPVHSRLSWRLDFALTYLRGVIYPVSALPTALPQPQVAVTSHPTATTTPPPPTPTKPGPTSTPLPTPTAIPKSVSLPAPKWEKQDINNCGPASLTMYLRYYGWQGDQFDIANVLKPQREDRNVNVEELAYFVRTHAGWLNVQYRVGGTLDLLKELLAAGFPLIIEESFYFEAPYWPNDDLWAAHYNLLTGYDDVSQTFTGQDSFYGPNRAIRYRDLDSYWQVFNRVILLVYPPEREGELQAILGPDWDVDNNRQRALETAQAEAQADPNNAFAWFNIGTNLVYFERYSEAAEAYDKARQIGLPQRMLRYQFGPFFAYFHSGRIDDLLALTKYALQRTPNAEEALLWHGWALYRQGKTAEAIADFRKALEENPNYQDAQYALDFVGANP